MISEIEYCIRHGIVDKKALFKRVYSNTNPNSFDKKMISNIIEEVLINYPEIDLISDIINGTLSTQTLTTMKVTTLEGEVFHIKKQDIQLLFSKYVAEGLITPTNVKKVVCSESGKVYDSIKKASTALNIKYETLKSWLSGKYPNKSSLTYL